MILFSIIIIAFIIFLHELGHFLAARMLHVPVFEFAIGMGKTLIKKEWKGTIYSLRILPIGGFCSFDDGTAESLTDIALNKQPTWKRFFIFFGGPFFNLISALIASFFICAAIGLPVPTTAIANVALKEADPFFREGDIIVEVNGVDVENDFNMMRTIVGTSSDGTAEVKILREENGETSLLEQKINLISSGESYILGLNMQTNFYKSEGVNAFFDGISYWNNCMVETISALVGLFTGATSVKNMSGIVGAVSSLGDAMKQNVLNFASSFVSLSVCLGIFNLLPIPCLDGSKILFSVYEMITKKRIPEKFELIVSFIAMIGLAGFMIFITLLDIQKLLH